MCDLCKLDPNSKTFIYIIGVLSEFSFLISLSH